MTSASHKKMMDWALYYRSIGWSPFPVGGDKAPLVDWKLYQTEKASEEQINQWWGRYPEANIGIATGKVSGIVAIDVERNGDFTCYPQTITSQTGGGGQHFIYQWPGHPVPNSTNKVKLTDVRGDGGYIVVPPSVHRSGKAYEWLIPPGETDPQPLPELSSIRPATAKKWEHIAEGVGEGERNMSAASFIGELVHALPQELWPTAAWDAALAWNSRCSPPLATEELRRTFESIAARQLNQPRATSSHQTRPLGEAVAFQDLALMEVAEPEWTVHRLIPKGGITVISSPPGLYKSFLLSHIAIACALGTKVLGEYGTQQQAVMIVDEENHKNRLARRIKLLTDQLDLPIYYHIGDGFRVDNEQQAEALLAEAKRKSIGLIMFDTLVRIHNQDENSATAMNQVYLALRKFTEAGMTVVLAHHHRKQGTFKIKVTDIMAQAEAMRGSSDILGMVDSHLAIVSKEDEGNTRQLVLVQTKQRDDELLKPFVVKVISEPGRVNFEGGGEYDDEAYAAQEAKERLLEILGKDDSGLSHKQLVKALKDVAGSTSMRAARDELVAAGVICSKTLSQLRKEGIDKGDGGTSTRFYFLKRGDGHTKDELPF